MEKMLLFVTDLVTINATFFIWCRLRSSSGLFSEVSSGRIFYTYLAVFGFWFLLFVFFGLYRFLYTQSRTDEFIAVVKTVTIGVFFSFLFTFDSEYDLIHPLSLSRFMIILYWGMLILLVGFGRVLLWTVHRKLLEMGVGRRRTLIVGWGEKARELFNRVVEAPALGYEVVGFVTIKDGGSRGSYRGIPVRGELKGLHRIIQREAIQEILIAFPRRSERHLEEVIAQCNGTSVGLKIVPDLYDVIIGQVRTNQIYGFPLIEILPQFMPLWERIVKRMEDIVFSLIILVGLLPIWLIIAAAIRMDSKGQVFYAQKRVGKDGKVFKMIKFRTMVVGAEKMTGPIWAVNNDPRVTRVGRFLRRLRLDEVPQFINILDGDMSLVGPRPERPHFVEKFKKIFPLYTRRLKVRPGITGWAQVKSEYDQSLESVGQKLGYDLFYLENMSLRMDLKILLNTLYVMLRGKGQ